MTERGKDAASEEGEGAGREFLDALANGLAVLAGFHRERRVTTIQDTAEQLAVTRASARRLLLTLKQLGYLAQDGKLFGPTPKVLDLGQAYFRALGLADAAQPLLDGLTRRTGWSSALGVLDGAQIVFVARAEAPRMIRLDLRPGDRLPAFAHSIGRVLLAHAPPEALDVAMGSPLVRRYTPRTRVDRAEVEDELARVRAQGWARMEGELVEGLSGLAVPILGPGGRAVAGLNVTTIGAGWTSEQVEQEILPALLETAGQISGIATKLR